ncbi:MAG: glycosyltransferase family 39 protein [Chloroflexota bacterium]
MIGFLRDNGFLGLMLIAFLVLGFTYSLATPVFEASDEILHYPVVKHIADGEGLPIQDPSVGTAWRQEGSQPPLYYLVAALATFWIDTGNLDELLWRNPHSNIGIHLDDGNKNMVVHTARESFPWHGAALAVHLIRLLSVLLGTTTVYLTYRIAMAVFPGNAALALGAASLTAFNPMFLFISASVNNDNLANALSSLALLQMILLVKRHSPNAQLQNNRRHHIEPRLLLGVTLGLATLTKLSALGLIPLAVLAAAVIALRQWSWPEGAPGTSPPPGLGTSQAARTKPFHALTSIAAAFGRDCVLILLPVAAIAGWWYVRNWQLYGDPTGLNAMLAIAGTRPSPPGLWELVREEQEGFLISYWGLFGAVNVLMDNWVYRLLNTLMAVAALGLALATLRALWARRFKLEFCKVALWPAIVLAALVRWTSLTLASQGRLMFPAIAALSLLLTLGLSALWPRKDVAALAAGLGGLLFALALLAPFRYIIPAYPGPDLLRGFDPQTVPHRVHINYDGKAELVGYETDTDRVTSGQSFNLTLYWRALAPMDRDYSVFIHVYGLDSQHIGQEDSYPGKGSYPTRLWQPGQALRDTYRLTIAPQANAPTQARIEVGLYELSSRDELPRFDGQGRPLKSPILGTIKVAAARPAQYQPEERTSYNLGNRAALIGYDLAARQVRPGGSLAVTLYWKVLESFEADYTVFCHLAVPGEKPVAQADGVPVRGFYPTKLWEKGEVIADEYLVQVAPEAPPGSYRLLVGMYLPSSGQRLPVIGEGGKAQGDTIALAEVQVSGR